MMLQFMWFAMGRLHCDSADIYWDYDSDKYCPIL